MGNLIFGTTTIEGRTFDDIKIQTSKAGVPRPIVFGKVFPIVGNVIATTAPKIVKKKEKQDSGKGGGSTEVVNDEVYRTYAIRICEGPITGISRVWRNNELVYERDSSDSTQIENNRAFTQIAEFFLGDWDQMPSSVMQAAFGVSEVHAYRGTCYMVIDNENLTSTGGAIPQFAFEVERAEGRVLTSRLYPLEQIDNFAASHHSTSVRVIPDYSYAQIDGLSPSISQVAADLRQPLQSLDTWPAEALAPVIESASAEMRSLLQSTEFEAEGLDAAIVGASGSMRQALIPYNNYPAEGLDVSIIDVTGEFT
ncbi:hypothetical protein ACJJIF_06920 [Microbulbifer sp. SSSA002]|uniref:hypothetical protein n=1 Tax=Microbulbifer sp. SSSA002 TaxID=3243376 RepID=UPI00403A31DC